MHRNIRNILEWWHHLKTTIRLSIIIISGIVGAGMFFVLLGLLFNPDEWSSVLINLGTELLGASVTFYLLHRILGLHEKREQEQEEAEHSKADLIARLGSSVCNYAVAAAEDLRRHGWLTDGSLHRANLTRANLQGAVLSGAQLQGAIFVDATMQYAVLSRANLQGARLDGINLQGANLEGASLRDAILTSASLNDADLNHADLRDANLIASNLNGANLYSAQLCNAYLSNARLRQVNLQQANLRGANVRQADLQGADLRGANLTGVTFFEEAKLDSHTLFDEHTVLPNGHYWKQT